MQGCLSFKVGAVTRKILCKIDIKKITKLFAGKYMRAKKVKIIWLQ